MSAVDTSSNAPSRVHPDPLPGTGYRALRRLGGGATSEVYQAEGPRGARFAVKVLRDAFADTPEAADGIEREARALEGLAHPSLAPVLDAGVTVDGRPFFVMPLLVGETLRARLAASGRLPAPEACAIVFEVLEALDVAHRAGVVHRDVKPGNVFLLAPSRTAGAPRAVLLDFGIAKLTGGRATTDAHVVGTPRYLAPEQIVGGAVDARTDVYAAGLTLFEAIAGRSPYDAAEGGDSVALMRAHIVDPGHRLRDLVRVGEPLDHAVGRAIAKSPGRRWPSARAFAEVLARAASPGRSATEALPVEASP
jgi:serine/threonine-protein kinase